RRSLFGGPDHSKIGGRNSVVTGEGRKIRRRSWVIACVNNGNRSPATGGQRGAGGDWTPCWSAHQLVHTGERPRRLNARRWCALRLVGIDEEIIRMMTASLRNTRLRVDDPVPVENALDSSLRRHQRTCAKHQNHRRNNV